MGLGQGEVNANAVRSKLRSGGPELDSEHMLRTIKLCGFQKKQLTGQLVQLCVARLY